MNQETTAQHKITIELEGVSFQMICEYLDELQLIKHLPPRPINEKRKYYQEVIKNKSTKWINVYAQKEDNGPIGFILIGYPPNCHPQADFYIEEAYIQPKYRRQHHMTTTVTNFIKTHPGTYCLFILNKNQIAKHFWFSLFAKLGYVPCYLTDVGAGDEHCTQYGFRPGSQN